MEKKYVALIIILCVAGSVAVGTLGGLYYFQYMQKNKTKSNYLLLSFIPAQFSIEVNSNGNWYCGYIIGSYANYGFSGTGNQTYTGSGSNAYVVGYLTSGSYLTLRIKVNGVTAIEQTITSTLTTIECLANSPFYYLLFLAFLI